MTEAAKHDRAVAAAAHELRQLVDTANAPIFGIDVKGNVNEWNNKTAEITGYTKEEAFDKPLVETFIVTKLRRSVQEVLDNALQGRETSNYELEFRTKSNETRYLLVNATTRRDAHNNIVGVVGVAQDVTEAAQHDRAVAAMARELRQLVDTANAPIFGIDINGMVNEWNYKTAEITGFSKEEAFDKPLVSTFIMPKLRQSVQQVMENALQGRETSNYELEFATKTNKTRYLLVNATTRRDEDNNIVGVVGVAQVRSFVWPDGLDDLNSLAEGILDLRRLFCPGAYCSYSSLFGLAYSISFLISRMSRNLSGMIELWRPWPMSFGS